MSLSERVAGKLHCLGCGRLYKPPDVQFVGVGQDELDLYICCSACGFYVRLTVPSDEAPSAVTAVLPQSSIVCDERRKVLLPPVTVEDVSAMRDFLSSFDGDVNRLLAGHPDGSS